MIRRLAQVFVAVVTLAALTITVPAAQAASRASYTSRTSTRTTTRRADSDRYQSDRRDLDEIRGKSFPRLGSRYEIVGHETPKYNCIAWSLGLTSRWVWPGTSVDDFDQLNSQYGYRRMRKMDFDVDPGVEKIVLYAKTVDGKLQVTHQARQNSDGTWTSKLGKLALIRHASPDSLDGPDYGKPVAVYYRKKAS